MDESVPESNEVKRHRAAVEREADLRLLEGRVRRKLRDGQLVLHKSRGEKQTRLLGRYWITDSFDVMPILNHVELPSLARRINVWFGDLNL